MAEFEPNQNPNQSWMDEAHRRADSSETSAWNSGAVKPRAEISAAALVAVISFSWLTFRGAGDVSSNLWQGMMLNGAYPVPVFGQALVSAVAWFDSPMSIVVLNVITRMLGAVTCAGVTAITVNAVRRVSTAGEAWICGVVAGLVFILAPSTTSAFTAAWPGAVTVSCAVWGLAALARAVQSRTRSGFWLTLGAGLCASAAANHAFLGWLAIPVFGATAFVWRHATTNLRGIVCAFLAWAGMLALPAINAIAIQREQPHFFLGRILRGPYPAIGEHAPDWNAVIGLGSQFHPLVWVFALASVILVVQRHVRAGLFAGVMLFVMSGPMAPFLMNQYDTGAFPRDDISLAVMSLAGFTIVFGLGLAASMQIIFRRTHALGYRGAMAALVFAIVALHQWGLAPDRRTELSGEFARTLLDGCPRDAILIVQDRAIAGMLNTAQLAYTHRRDVRVVPAGVLINPAARQYYRHVHPDGIHIDTAYDTQQHASTWQHERPLVTNALLNAEPNSHDWRLALDDLVLWEFVRDNFGARPVAFAGVNAPWLHARAAINGLVQVYPRVDAPLTDSMEAWLAMKMTTGLQTDDPELANAFAEILLSLSATRRAQNQGEEATRLAILATQYEEHESSAWMALARAAARNGFLENADAYSATESRTGEEDDDLAATLLARDHDAYDLVSKYQSGLDEDPPGDPDSRFRRQQIAEDLWLIDEIAVLADLMEQELRHDTVTARNLYELAAVYAQLGELAKARRLLRDAIALAPDDVESHLKNDGRFVLLEFDHVPSPHQTSL
jgi:tetratricopeptide (TPR) repeat protein